MPSDPERESDAPVAVEAPKKKKKRKKGPREPIPRTEREIDAPDRLTLFMLGAMCLVTLVLWGFARGACNYHPPRETRKPRPVKLEELARDPKGAALEMQQRLLQLDFKGAMELAVEGAAADVMFAQTDCQNNRAACAEKRKARERTVATVAHLLERDPASATARVISTTPEGKEAYIARLKRKGAIWVVDSRKKDDGSYKPQDQPDTPADMAPDGGASAAPVESAAPAVPTAAIKPAASAPAKPETTPRPKTLAPPSAIVAPKPPGNAPNVPTP